PPRLPACFWGPRADPPPAAGVRVELPPPAAPTPAPGPDSAFEWAVSGAASVLTHMLERGFSVRLLTDTGTSVPGEGSDGFAGASQESADAAGLLMDTLAVVDHSDGEGLSRAYDMVRGGSEGLLVAFLGDLDEEQTAVLARMRQRSRGAVAFLLDSGAWLREPSGASGPSDGVGERSRMLREAGWTVVSVPRGASLEEQWRLADRERSGLVAASGGEGAG
ncbi:DUF58 domain-containing protein, partial [Streptomyces hirsutus]